jgi:hypothetical protein
MTSRGRSPKSNAHVSDNHRRISQRHTEPPGWGKQRQTRIDNPWPQNATHAFQPRRGGAMCVQVSTDSRSFRDAVSIRFDRDGVADIVWKKKGLLLTIRGLGDGEAIGITWTLKRLEYVRVSDYWGRNHETMERYALLGDNPEHSDEFKAQLDLSENAADVTRRSGVSKAELAVANQTLKVAKDAMDELISSADRTLAMDSAFTLQPMLEFLIANSAEFHSLLVSSSKHTNRPTHEDASRIVGHMRALQDQSFAARQFHTDTRWAYS